MILWTAATTHQVENSTLAARGPYNQGAGNRQRRECPYYGYCQKPSHTNETC